MSDGESWKISLVSEGGMMICCKENILQKHFYVRKYSALIRFDCEVIGHTNFAFIDGWKEEISKYNFPKGSLLYFLML